MHAPLALLLSLVVLAHAAGALHWGSPGADELLNDRYLTKYEKGHYYGEKTISKHFHMAKEQCTAVIENKNLLCEVPEVGSEEWVPPLWVRVATSKDWLAPNIDITDKLDRVELRRQPPCRDRVEVYLDTWCEVF